jgi:hypothetical protein
MADVAFRPRAVVAPFDRHPLSDEVSLADLVAPSAIHIAVDHLVIDGQFARVLALVGLPPSVDPGWLEPLVAGSLPAEVSLFVVPAERGHVAGQLTRRHVRLQSSLVFNRKPGCMAACPKVRTRLTCVTRSRPARW